MKLTTLTLPLMPDIKLSLKLPFDIKQFIQIHYIYTEPRILIKLRS